MPSTSALAPVVPATGSASVGLFARGSGRRGPALCGALSMWFVGGSVAVSSVLAEAPSFTAQALRYAAASLLLLIGARVLGHPVRLPRGREWLWLAGVTGLGLVLFNIALVEGSRHAEPAVLGVAVACVPLVFALVGPVLDGRRPRPAVVAAAILVSCGAVAVQGAGRADAVGLAWAAVVFACEAGFTLLAIPLFRAQGPWGVSFHTTWLAAAAFGVLGLANEGPAAALDLRAQDVAAIAYLAICVTAVAFVLWYSCVLRLGAGRAGLLTGIAPISAAAIGVLMGGAAPSLPVWIGIALVALGLALGLRSREVAALAG